MAQPIGLTEHVAIVKRRLAALSRDTHAEGPSSPVVDEALEALQMSLEEMQVTGEELRVQNEELATSREMLEAERRRYRQLFEDAPDAYLVTALDGCVQEANAAAGALFGLPSKYLPGKPIAAFVADDQLRPFRLELTRARDVLRREGWEFRVERRGGGQRDVSATVTVVREPGHNESSLRWILHDITERVRAAEAHRQRAFLEAVVTQMPGGVVVAHADGTLAAGNAHAEALAGVPLAAGSAPHVAVLDGWADAAGRALPPRAFPLSRALRGERVETEDFVYARADGSRLSLSVNAGPILGPNGEVTAAVAAFTDVSARRRAEARDRVMAEAGAVLAGSLDSAETLRQVARISAGALATLCLVHVAGRDGVRVVALAHRESPREDEVWALLRAFPREGEDANPVFRALRTGLPLLLADVSDADLADAAESTAQHEALRRMAPRSAMIVPLTARGGTLGALTLVRGDGVPRFDAEDLEVALDLATRAALAVENARLYEESARAARARDDMLAVVSHDLRNPIQAVLVSSVLLRDFPRVEHDERERKQIDIIHRSAEQMARLVDDLVEIAAVEGGALSLRCAVIPPEPLLDTAVAMIAAAAEAGSVTVVREPCPPLPAVNADAERVLQVLGNLLGNAVKFTPEGGTVTLSAAVEGDEVRMRVADQGPGIAPEHLPHVFDRFWQVKSARHTAGLGLAIAKALVEAHGGRVGVESTPGTGSLFWVTFPVASAGTTASEKTTT